MVHGMWMWIVCLWENVHIHREFLKNKMKQVIHNCEDEFDFRKVQPNDLKENV
jgi:hypothetical protein